MLKNLGLFMLGAILIHAVMLIGACLILRKKFDNVTARISTIATTFANSAFFGIPILEAIYPGVSDDLIIYTVVFAVVMNVIGWTIGSAIISQNIKYVAFKKIFTNPALIGAAVAMILFVTEAPITQAQTLFSLITTTAKMSTPISMMVMGMRLASMKLSDVFGDYRVYLTVAVKQFAMPLVAFLMVVFLPISADVKTTFFIISSCPIASSVLNYSELAGLGQKQAACLVLLGTILCVVTLPVMMLLLPLL